MNLRWSLDDLYTGFDSGKFRTDFESFKTAIPDFNIWARENLKDCANPKEKLEYFINKTNEISSYGMLVEYCFLITAVDAENIEAQRFIELYQELETDLVPAQTMFINFVKEIENLDELIAESPILTEHAFYLNETKQNAQYVLSEKEESVLSKIKNTGSNAWSTLHSQLTSTLMCDIEVDGKPTQLPLTFIRNMAYDNDMDTRKKAYEAEVSALKKIDKPAAACLNAIKGEAISEAKMRGYKDLLDMTLKDSRMEEQTLAAMFSAINDYLPMFEKYFNHKAKFFGDEKGLKYWNLFAPVGDAGLTFTYKEAAQYVVDNFSKFSPELGYYAKNAFENDWLDVEPREGKSGGAFCAGVHRIKQSRIMSNFSVGSFEEMLTLAHELGHGFHGYCLKDVAYLNSDYPMPIAETASTFCETLVCDAALKDADNATKLSILDNQIQGAAQVIADINARYLFESQLIKRRENGSLSVTELNELMVDSLHKSYRSGMDEETIHPYMWIVKGHYYSADRNFYNFPYAYGHLFSLGLYAKYLEQGESFVAKYKELLAATGDHNLKDVALLCDIDVNDKAFWVSSLKLIERDIEAYVGLEI